MTYTVKFKLKNSLFWKKMTDVKGDLIASDMKVPTRVLILENESRVEIPIEGTIFWFCPKRFLVIKQNMEREAGQNLSINTRLNT